MPIRSRSVQFLHAKPWAVSWIALLAAALLLAFRHPATLADDAAESALRGTALAARGLTSSTTRTFKQKHRIAGVDMKSRTLVLRSRTPLALFVNREEATRSRRDFDQFLAEWRRDLKSLARDKATLSGDYGYEDKSALTFCNPAKLICVRHENYRFMGGAHGIEGVDPVCYGFKAGKPARLTLGDFFKPGTNYRALVGAKLMAGLKANSSAAWVQDGTLSSVSAGQLSNFQVERGGLRWWFNPYEAGPYAVGYIEVKLSVKELGPGFRADLLAVP